jgi:hypothetical protein
MNHRVAAMGVAFGARLDAGLAPDAAVRVDEEVQIFRLCHGDGYGEDESACAGRPVRVHPRLRPRFLSVISAFLGSSDLCFTGSLFP